MAQNATTDPSEGMMLVVCRLLGTLTASRRQLFKRMIWEAMNKDYDKGKSRKRARMYKKGAPGKKPEKAVKVSTVMDTKNGLRSKINYDALDKLNEELFLVRNPGNVLENGVFLRNSFEGSHDDDDFEHESNGYSEEAEARQGHDDDTYVANDEYNGCNYDDEYNYNVECDFDEL
ncbi:uncharacterized protein LOC110750815 [Prunus avium]|uniref:Uncharacterized protein LOC110750815 n=1 Tax=Prunus avium TaxID=42229 RepID=A0A6P5RYT4_PRUAV|nr:uncharacterized protein LOC110750815 [Prunus avium]